MKISKLWPWLSLLGAPHTPLKAAETSAGNQALKAMMGKAHRNVGIEIPVPKKQQVLKLPIEHKWYKNLNPYYTRSTSETLTVSQILEGLLYRNEKGEVQGACAETWDYDAETFTWTFKLRPNLKWNDGSPLTVDDFVRGIQAKFDPQTYPHHQIPSSLLPGLLKSWNFRGAEEVLKAGAELKTLGVWAEDKQTLKLQFTVPCMPELYYDRFASPNCIPLHPQYLQNSQVASKPEDYKKLVGTNGPFQLVSLTPGSGMTLKKNPHFWDADNVLLQEVQYIQYQDGQAAVRAWQAGEVDISQPIESEELQTLATDNYAFLSRYVSASWFALMFNLNCPKLQDRRVRQAINLILDRNELEKFFALPPQAQLYGYLMPGCLDGLPYNCPNWAQWPHQRRLKEAKRLMLEAGYHRQNKLKLNLSMVSRSNEALFKGILGYFRELEECIDLTAYPLEALVFSERIRSKEFELGISSFFIPLFHPFIKYRSLYHGGAGNLLGFQNQAYDEAIKAFESATSAPESGAALLALERILWEEAPVIPLFALSHYHLVNAKVGGWEKSHLSPISPAGIIMCRYLFKKH